MLRGIAGNVLILGAVSFLTDVSSEMIYPLLPLFLTTVLGAGPAFLGVIEGGAESTAALLKLLSGIFSDRLRSRKGPILFGYGLSTLARPLVAAATSASFVLGVRLADRVGKGIRTSPRDALIADSTGPGRRGLAFGFHRAMDHFGALTGPLVAALLLATVVRDLRTLFWLAAVPGLLAVLLVLLRVREVAPERRRLGSDGRFLLASPKGVLRRYLLILFLFTLGNSSDAFLLLRAGELGVAEGHIPVLWAVFHLVKTVAAYGFGVLSDRWGRRGLIVAGWGVYLSAYIGFALAVAQWQAWLLFGWYALYYGLTEGVEKALLVDLAPPAERGGAFGWYNCAVGVGALPASLLFGLLWQHLGAAVAFGFGAALAAAAALLLLFLVRVPAAGQRGG